VSMVWIGGISPTSATTNINFDAIPQTFTHLQFRVFASANNAGGDTFTIYGFDGTGGSSNSAYHTLYGNGISVFSAGASGQYNPGLTQMPGTSATSTRGVAIIDILDYRNTNKYKTVRSIGGYDANGSGYVALTSVLAFGIGSSTALTSVWFYIANSFAAGSRIDLYGITTSSVTGA
jgi:hypothetical protein